MPSACVSLSIADALKGAENIQASQLYKYVKPDSRGGVLAGIEMLKAVSSCRAPARVKESS
eukprot:5741934-Amphidinium_carterae.1